MPMQWTLANERLLLLVLLDTIKGSLNYKQLAENWPEGNGEERPTHRALSEHIFKLRKLAVQSVRGGNSVQPTEQAQASTPKTPRHRAATRSGGRTGSSTGNSKTKRKRDATEDPLERTFTPVNSRRIKTEPGDESMNLAAMMQETPSKRDRKSAMHLNMVATEGSGTDDDDDDVSIADPDFAPDDFVDYEGNADKFELPPIY